MKYYHALRPFYCTVFPPAYIHRVEDEANAEDKANVGGQSQRRRQSQCQKAKSIMKKRDGNVPGDAWYFYPHVYYYFEDKLYNH